MHNSVITITVFLLIGLLIMSALTLNVNLLPNVMAQEYNYYDSYNDYGDDDSKYSKYPDKVNKYECQTGPFEGFFVGSVEFCKNVKFDDNNDVEDGNGVGVEFCILESLEGCFQQHVDESKIRNYKTSI